EDGTFADAADDVLTVPDSAAIGIPHPVDLDGSLDAWSALFSDYEILQPFPQLDRTVQTLTDAERAARRLERFQGKTVATRTPDRLGWHRTAPMDAGLQHAFYRAVPGGRSLNISLAPRSPSTNSTRTRRRSGSTTTPRTTPVRFRTSSTPSATSIRPPHRRCSPN
ncbi:DUF4132 domain-containing protein, partial [Actinomadura adrarensis]